MSSIDKVELLAENEALRQQLEAEQKDYQRNLVTVNLSRDRLNKRIRELEDVRDTWRGIAQKAVLYPQAHEESLQEYREFATKEDGS